MLSRKWVSLLRGLTLGLLFAVACSDDPAGKPSDAGTGGWTNVCVDLDGDGYGFQCELGSDCNDSDSQIHVDCQKCTKPNLGCDCVEGTESVECSVTPVLTASGTLLCKEGTRYCRDGKWTDCEGIVSFEAPAPAVVQKAVKLQGLIRQDAAVPCGPCTPDCYQIEDPIDPPGDAGVSRDAGYAYTSNGGITLGGTGTADAAVDPDAVDQVPPCDTAADSDCDGIPNVLDPLPTDKPFESDHSTIFMDLAAGEAKSNTFDLRFFLKTADIYFLIDMTGSMDDEKNNLLDALKAGNFLDDPATPMFDESIDVECADRDFNGAPDNNLKQLGVTGNIACLIRSAGFGTGWYREIAFSATDTYGIKYTPTPDLEGYEHRQDIAFDFNAVDLVQGSLTNFVTRGNKNWAESGGVALSAVATGGPVYMGWDRPGIPPRICPAGRFGYPCFRSDAMPIVVLITDAPIMNGPIPAQGHLGQTAAVVGNYNAQPVNYDARGLAYQSSSSDAKYHPVSGNESFASAYDVGAVHTTFKTYTGNTRTMTADVHTNILPVSCSAFPSTSAGSPGHPDAVFKFKVTDATKKVTISTRGSRFKAALAVFPVTNIAVTDNPTIDTAKDLGQLTSTSRVAIRGNTSLATFDTGELSRSMVMECLRGKDINVTAPDAWYKFTVASDMNNVKFAIDGDAFDPILGLWAGPPAMTEASLSTRKNDRPFENDSAIGFLGLAPAAIDGKSFLFNNASTNKTGIAADYGENYFKNADTSCEDVNGTAFDGVIDFSLLTPRTVRIETTAATNPLANSDFDHVIGLFARPATAMGAWPNALTCNRNGNGTYTNRSSIERTLGAGSYSVIVRGERRGASYNDRGTYGLVVSDVSARPVGCMIETDTTSFTANLKANVTYYLAMRGQKTGRGLHTITIGADTTSVCAYDNTTYSAKSNPDDDSDSTGMSEIVDQTFPVGEYYVVVKGRGDHYTQGPTDKARGWYQLTIGDRALAVDNQTATMPVWGNAASGIQKDLLDKGIRVITVASVKACNTTGCSGGAANANLALQQQADIISQSTKAITSSQTTRGFDIFNNGAGLGFAVVNAIAKLTANVSMDVSVRFVPLPETPAKPFIFTSRAIDVAGDLCSPPVDTNADGIPDTHKQCAPGAVPRFQVTFKNPAAPNNVPVNPTAGSNGGYNMRIELIGDGKYVIDQTPVFIIPQAVLPTPPKFLYDQTGSYSQDIAGNCPGTDRPNWQSLAWNDTLPKDTSLQWRMCAADTAAELDACQTMNGWRVVATVTPGSACTSSSQCGTGYCSSGTCHHPVSPAGVCTASSDCGTNGVCGAGGTCAWTANPISLVPALKSGLNGKTRIRLQVNMTASPTRTEAPTVQDFKLTYVCSPGV